jgi:hypothetical protein
MSAVLLEHAEQQAPRRCLPACVQDCAAPDPGQVFRPDVFQLWSGPSLSRVLQSESDPRQQAVRWAPSTQAEIPTGVPRSMGLTPRSTRHARTPVSNHHLLITVTFAPSDVLKLMLPHHGAWLHSPGGRDLHRGLVICMCVGWLPMSAAHHLQLTHTSNPLPELLLLPRLS